MAIDTLRQDNVTLDAELLEELMASTEAPVSDAPGPCPEAIGPVLLLSPKEPKEPKEPRRR
ncbi:hypothetical protein [Streptomyces sp. S.PNR 29]|uniref:hypothetical protein n=1 Tax=Streptomyces sp. S.PNR 29 TaxID=2973805 RepID=UPI0025B1EE95|nr:hypothetical protein [Streptomyces sp. S.PNR 29]MDN0193561.1 hypothetical protein [Streptomyces sp. S.PNR 29]